MANDNETVADVVREMRSGNYGCDRCGDSCDCPNADAIMLNVNFFKAIGVRAHLVRREVGEWEDVQNV